MEIVTKTSGEKITLTIDFTDRLPTGATVSTATVAAVEYRQRTNVASTLLVSTTGTVTTPNVSFTVQNGTSKLDYLVTVLATLSTGSQKISKSVLVRVFDE